MILGISLLLFSLYLSIRVFPLPRFPSSPASLDVFKSIGSAGISTCYPSDTPSRPLLRSRLTLGGRTFPRKPETFDGKDSHLALATYSSILSSVSSTNAFALASSYYRMLLYHCSTLNNIYSFLYILLNVLQSAISVDSLAPVIFRANSLDQ